MISALPRVMERDGAPAVAELLAMLGVVAWATGLVWLAVHLLTRAYGHHGHRQVRQGHPRRS